MGVAASVETNARLLVECTSGMHFSPLAFIGCGLDHRSTG